MSNRILKPRRNLVEEVATHHEEAAHGVVYGDSGDAASPLGSDMADRLAQRRKSICPAAARIAASDHKVGFAELEHAQHLRQKPLVVLEIGVHHRDELGPAGKRALEAGAGKAAPADSSNAAHPAVVATKLFGDCGCRVG
jgi:hypothetical protein